ncbi:hypothetical protein A4G19_02040 [Pasteurellaceae bacterium Macca]|nr:hypothetical protein [Pasteurellaceae bacterium Macca]
MSDYFIAFLGLFNATEHQFFWMFFSAFLSSTLLPGNSEIVFSAFAAQYWLLRENAINMLFFLWLIATLGNTLGSLTTYAFARYLPQLNEEKFTRKSAQWAFHYSQKYGVYILLLSWLPIVGDLFCAIAGWLRFPFRQTCLFLFLGKGARYAILLLGLKATAGQIL